jgi:hypothetical protein
VDIGQVGRSRASAGGTLAATRALLEWNLRITANIAGAPGQKKTRGVNRGIREQICAFNCNHLDLSKSSPCSVQDVLYLSWRGISALACFRHMSPL